MYKGEWKMKRPKIIGLLITAFLITTSFAGCGDRSVGNNAGNENNSGDSSESPSAAAAGNTNGNLNNSGIAALTNGWIYYYSGTGLHMLKADDTDGANLNGDEAWYVNAVGDWIYYLNGGDGYKLYKVKTDGSGKAKVSDERMYAMHVVGDWVYYTDYADSIENSGKIYRIKTDGSGKALLSDTASACINITGDWIYYGSGNALFKMKTDGSGKTKLTEDASYYNIVGDINVSGSWIYYTEYSEYSGKLQKIKTDGSGKTLVNSGMSRHVNVVGEWIYYVNADDNSRLYKMKTDGSGKTKLDDGMSSFPNIAGDWIFYYNEDTSEYCRIKTDGSGKAALSPKVEPDAGYYILPESNARYLSDSEVSSLSALDLGIARNEIFARHGYVFGNQWYKDYFTSQSWYAPNPEFKGSFEELNQYEVYNVQLIQKYEAVFEESASYILPDSSTRYLAESEISSLSKEQLALARNEIFARHGYLFQTQKYADYFNSKSWYVQNPNFSGDLEELNAYEQYNINLIQKAEANSADQLVYITSIDKDRLKISYDLTSGIIETDDGYIVKNESTMIRTKSLAEDATFYILAGGSSELVQTDFEGLWTMFESGRNLYRLEIQGDRIVKVVQQYMP
ncbi:MAG: domain/zinc-ribbon domain [Firmicutes bacterium]|nr:domain/zinc-ribbon domain [Bacillota bacterium]